MDKIKQKASKIEIKVALFSLLFVALLIPLFSFTPLRKLFVFAGSSPTILDLYLQTKGNRISSGEFFKVKQTSPSSFKLCKNDDCSGYELYNLKDGWINLRKDTTWTDVCPGGGHADCIRSSFSLNNTNCKDNNAGMPWVKANMKAGGGSDSSGWVWGIDSNGNCCQTEHSGGPLHHTMTLTGGNNNCYAFQVPGKRTVVSENTYVLHEEPTHENWYFNPEAGLIGWDANGNGGNYIVESEDNSSIIKSGPNKGSSLYYSDSVPAGCKRLVAGSGYSVEYPTPDNKCESPPKDRKPGPPNYLKPRIWEGGDINKPIVKSCKDIHGNGWYAKYRCQTENDNQVPPIPPIKKIPVKQPTESWQKLWVYLNLKLIHKNGNNYQLYWTLHPVQLDPNYDLCDWGYTLQVQKIHRKNGVITSDGPFIIASVPKFSRQCFRWEPIIQQGPKSITLQENDILSAKLDIHGGVYTGPEGTVNPNDYLSPNNIGGSCEIGKNGEVVACTEEMIETPIKKSEPPSPLCGKDVLRKCCHIVADQWEVVKNSGEHVSCNGQVCTGSPSDAPDCCDCTGATSPCPVVIHSHEECDNTPTVYKPCESWQVCTNANEVVQCDTNYCPEPGRPNGIHNTNTWKGEAPTCKCWGKCISEIPYFSYEDGRGPIGEDNVHLPVYISWSAIPGFWIDSPPGNPAPAETINSFGIDIKEKTKRPGASQSIIHVPVMSWGNLDDGTGYAWSSGNQVIFSPNARRRQPCTLSSAKDYGLLVRACCGSQGSKVVKGGTVGNCKDIWSGSSFHTSSAPEPISPYDPDWNKRTCHGGYTDLPVTLQWCCVDGAKYYPLRVFYMEDDLGRGKDICHPDFWQMKAPSEQRKDIYRTGVSTNNLNQELCSDWIIRAEKAEELGIHQNNTRWCSTTIHEKDGHTRLLDAELGLFSKPKEEIGGAHINGKGEWQVATVFSNDVESTSTYPRDYSQMWQLKTQPFSLRIPQAFDPAYPLFPPKKGRKKTTPPVVNFDTFLNWQTVPRALSYRFRLIKVPHAHFDDQGNLTNANDGEIVNLSPQQLLINRGLFRKGSTVNNTLHMISIENLWKGVGPNSTTLEPDYVYIWCIAPCWDEEGNQCSKYWNKSPSNVSEACPEELNPQIFVTAGAAPQNWHKSSSPSIPLNPGEESTSTLPKAALPGQLKWDKIIGAASYKIVVQKEDFLSHTWTTTTDAVTKDPEVYIHATSTANYRWKVKSCADHLGKYCGQWNPEHSYTKAYYYFTGVFLRRPVLVSPQKGLEIQKNAPNITFDWIRVRYSPCSTCYGPGIPVPAYQYRVVFGHSLEDNTKIGPKIIWEKIVQDPGGGSVTVTDTIPLSQISQGPGVYYWQVRPLLDTEGKEAGPWSGINDFSIVTHPYNGGGGTGSTLGGLVPCGREKDNPNTPWDETEKCQFKHIFISLAVITKFLIKLSILVELPVLFLVSAIIAFYPTEEAQPLLKIKNLWKEAGKGYLILLLSNVILDTILKVLGFTYKWWQNPFK